MAQNPFDQFDDAQGENPFDAFDESNGSDSQKRKSQATAADYLRALDTGFAQGITGIGAAAGTILQDPGGAIVSGLTGARAAVDRGLTHLINAVEPGVAEFNTEQQRAAQIASEVAAERRAANSADPINLPARLGRFMEQDSRRVTEEIKARERATNPELVAQQQEMAKAEGFLGNIQAAWDNPLALSHTLARSAPDMALGVGIGSTLKRAGAGIGAVSASGTATEAASSGMQAREGTYQQVAEMPLETLAKSPRFIELLQARGGNAIQAREALANELADQTPVLSAMGTAAGTWLTNRLFGGDATAKSIMGAEKMTARELGQRVLQDTVEEGFQGVPEDTVQHGAVVQADPSKKWDPAGSLAQNMVAGLAMGAGGHGMAYARENMGRAAPAPAPEPAPATDRGLAVDVTYQNADGKTVTSHGEAPASSKVATADTTEAEKALRTPVTLTALDRVNEIDGEVSGITQRLTELTPENGYGPTFDQERQELAAQAAELAQERAGIAATWPKAINGAPTAFSTEAGVKLDAQYALMDAADLVTSHTESLRPNPLYPQELQPRDRSRDASEMQVSGIVQKLDPARLGVSADAGTGAPIVGADGLVESGNARTIAMKRVYQANGQKASDYKQFLRDNAAQFGLAPEAVDALEKPVLVRVRSTPVNRAEFARQANASTVQRMSPSEQALSDAKRLTSLDGLNPTEDGDFSSNTDFIRQFMATLPITEQSDLIESDGRLSTAGYRRIQNAVLGRAYGDSPSLRRMTESMDNNLVNVSKALLRVAPTIAAARERMQAGTLHQADIAPDLLAAVEGLSALKEKGWTVAQELAQTDLTGPRYTPEAAELLGFLSDNIRSPRRIAEFFQRYYEALEQAGDPGQPSMFGDDGPAPARADLLKQAQGAQNGNTDQNPERGVDREGARPAAQDGRQSQDAPGRGRSDEGDGPAGAEAAGGQPGKPAGEAANDGASEWVAFPVDSGTLGIPRRDMPQVKAQHRGALMNFLASRGIEGEKAEVRADSLKPTQAEFSRAKVERFMESGPMGERSVLVSSDGYVLDGHHQWMAASSMGIDVPVIRLGAPIQELLATVREFPSVQQSEGADSDPRAMAVQDFKDALADLAQIASKHTRAAMVPENTPELMPTLVKLFDSAIRLVGTDMKAATRWVKSQIKADARFKTFWNKIGPELYQKAALQALENPSQPVQAGLFDSPEAATSAVQGGLFDVVGAAVAPAPKVAKINGRAYDQARDNYAPPKVAEFMPAAAIAAADKAVADYPPPKDQAAPILSSEDRARAEAMLAPVLAKVADVKAEFDQKIIDIARDVGALGQLLADLKGLKRGAEKLALEEKFDVGGMKDLLRSTIVVANYADAQAVMDAIEREFTLLRAPKNRTGDAPLRAQGKDIAADDPAKYAGYSDIMVNVVLPNGTIAEIQINTPNMLAAKAEHGHVLYESLRIEPKGSERAIAINAASVAFYDAARSASQRREAAASDRSPEGSSEIVMPPDGGSFMSGRSSRVSPSSNNLNQPFPGNSANQSPPKVGTNREPSGNLSGTLMDSPFDSIVVEGADNGYNFYTTKEADNANAQSGEGSAQAQGAGAVQGAGRPGQADGVRLGSGGRYQQPDRVDDAAGPGPRQVGRPGSDGVRQQNEGGSKPKSGKGTRPDAGVPAGRDIPAKSGLNYEFGPDDLTYEGSWVKKAEQNAQAVELVKALEKEGRQATAEEQKILAKFIGWGSSDMANNLFGAKLDKASEAEASYQEAIAAMGERTYLTNARYAEYSPAFRVLQFRNPDLNWYTAGNITREMLDKARPSASELRWVNLRNRLKEALTKEEWAEASRSTQYAHYTSKSVVQSMWKAMERMGFKGGHVLEPGAGIGVFAGLMPTDIANNSSYTGIEFDSITGGVLKNLFPDERILVESFVDSKLPKNFYDVAIGNPPFAGWPVLADPEYAKKALSLHDYFFAKSIDRVKPGGLVMYVTSRYTMDKLNDKARAYLSERADLVGAIRLPQTAFKQNAGTDVVTDVIFLRKKVPGQAFEYAKPWGKSVSMTVGSKDFPVNEYFHAHPEMVLGTPSDTGTMQNSPEPQYTVLAPTGDIEALFAKAVESLPENIYTAGRGSSAEAAKVREIDFNPKAKKEGNYYVTDAGVLMVREGGVGQRATLKKPNDAELIKDFVPLRDALKQAHYDQLNNGEWEKSLEALKQAYDKFTKKHGAINQSTAKTVSVKVEELDEDGNPTGKMVADEEVRRSTPLLDKLKDDPDWTLVAALEKVNGDTGEVSRSEFLDRRVLGAKAETTVATPADALLTTLNDLGHVDMGVIAQRIGLSEQETIDALGSSVYNDPEGGWTTADEYLSGNVKHKLQLARAAAKSDRRFERNVTALEAHQPEPLAPSQISPRMGMNWIPGDIYSQFMRDQVGIADISVEWDARLKSWNFDWESPETHEVTNRWGRREKVYKSQEAAEKAAAKMNARFEEQRYLVRAIETPLNKASIEDWGTPNFPAQKLMEHAITGAPVKVYSKDTDGKPRLDEALTEAANEKLKKLHAEFEAWVFAEPNRSDRLVQLYNDKFNTTVARSFDGSHLTLPGASMHWQKQVHAHVKRGVWRIVQTGNTYLAHAVGSGKTAQMVMSAMEQKRLGLIKKPMIVVPNHMLKQFASEWLDIYPAARLMVADEHNFHTDNRRRFVSRVALSDLDGVVITHSAFKLLDLDPEFKKKMIEEQLDFFRAALKEAGGDPDAEKGKSRDPKIKRIEAQIERMEQKLAAATSSEGKDKNARFDELGVDFLYVDEAHEYRKLDFTTKREVKGLSPQGSDKAFDLYMKSRYLESKTPGRAMVMASGTPVTNTMAELFSVQKMLGHQALVDKGLEDFDSWASMFGREKTNLEPDASGKYENVSRFQEFVNVPEMTQMFREFADVLTSDYLAEKLGDKRPKVEGGSRTNIITPKTAEYTEFQSELRRRMEESRDWKPSRDEPNNPDPVIRIIGDGRLAAIDMRFMDPSLPSNPDSKLNRMIDDVIAAYKETANQEFENKDKTGMEPAKGATMMVFSDLGFGAGVAASRGFNARAWMEKRLRDAGIAPSHLAFMQDYKKSSAKLKLFSDVNAGRVRILVGSSKSMGTGVNAQQRLKDLFHLDSPWYPADLEQREGRIVRQGNKNKVVRIKAYAAKGTYDEQMWGQLANKQLFIDKAMSGDPNVRSIEDAGAADNMAIMAGMVADDPRVLQLAGLETEINKLQRLFQAHEDTRASYRQRYQSAQSTAEWNEARLPEAEKLAAKAQDLSGDNFKAKVGGSTFTERAKWAEALIAKYKDLSDRGVTEVQKVGEISGFEIAYGGETVAGQYRTKLMLATPQPMELVSDAGTSPIGVAMRAQNAVTEVARLPQAMRERMREARATMDSLGARLETPFPMKELLAQKITERNTLRAEMASDGNKSDVAQDGEQDDEQTFPWDTLSDADFAAGAAMGSVWKTRLSRGSGGGMQASQLQALAKRIKANNPNMPDVVVLDDPSKAPKKLREYIAKQGATADAEGALHNGELYLFASGLRDLARAEHVLAAHEAAHFGLRAILAPKELKAALRMIWVNNAKVRKAATELQSRGKLTETEATEEVIVDIPSADLARLKGWRKVVQAVADFLGRRGYSQLQKRLDAWLDGTLSEQQRADLFVADLVRAARAYVQGQRPGRARGLSGVTRLSGSLADDLAKQEQWLNAEARARGFRDIDDLAERNYPLFERLAKLWREKNPADEGVLLSRSPAKKSAIERAEAIIQDQAAGAAPLDAAARALTRITGVERLTGAVYNKAAQLLDRYTPERVKAGIVSDYGVPEAVIDQRTLFQARQRVQLRKAGELVEKLATLTRAESRVAYEWMNMDGNDPKAYVSMMQGLPEESVKVLQDVQKMIDQLSQEAVRLGQLDADTFARNRFAYLRRSYAKYTLEQTAAEKAKRSRTIAVLGEQYKGRGLSESAPMEKIKAAAPDWWGRKLANGKADTALKGEKFVRLEYRTHKQSGVAVRLLKNGKAKPYYITRSVPLNTKNGQIPGLEVAAHETQLREVVYWPAGEKIPAQYSEWDQAGTWEVRDVKGPNAIFWRDFTKDERESMGEIDEARFAIAKTLHAMIHDVEVGRYLEWLAARQAKKEGETIPGTVVDASERMRDTFAPGEWVRVPDSKIQGTNVLKYGKLAGRYLPGPVWNDLRQVVGGQFQPFGETYAKILSLWKTSKTALSPAVHMNNVMSNFVMADWHDVHATQVGKALRILLAASQKPGGMADREAAVEILNRYKDSGGDAGSWVTQEISREQIEPLLESLQKELLATNGQSMAAQTGIFAALQHAMQLRFPEAWDAAKAGNSGKTVAAAGGKLIDLYQSEDDVFRLAAWLAAKERGATDIDAGKQARKSFLDYNINAPWVNAMRKSAWPFLSFTYRAVPMLLETAAKKPHKLMKLMALAGALNALGVILAGGDEDDERKLLPEEKAGGIWGMVPKLIRMPWNDGHGSPVYLDIRRWVPVGDVLDVGQGHAAVPILPGLMPGGPLVLMGEVVLNRSAFTGKSITLETDTPTQQAAKLGDYLFKAFAPNILGLPNTYATEGVVGSVTGRTDAFGREMSTAQAMASSFGVKLGSYPEDVMRKNLTAAALAQTSEIDKNINQLKRQLQTGRIDYAEFQELARAEQEKKVKIMDKLAEKIR